MVSPANTPMDRVERLQEEINERLDILRELDITFVFLTADSERRGSQRFYGERDLIEDMLMDSLLGIQFTPEEEEDSD